MTRMVRVAVPDYPHHVSQRIHCRQKTMVWMMPMLDRIHRWNTCLSDADNSKVKI
jgi:hypothetical protein